MTKNKLITTLYSLIAAACFMIALALFNIFPFIANLVALTLLLVACYYVGRYK